MLSPNNSNAVSIMVGGKTHDHWESYDVDSDLLTPADAWHVTLGLKNKELPSHVKVWDEAQVKVGQDLVMTGRIDTIEHDVEDGKRTLSITGRDYAGILIDCPAPVFVARQITLEEIMAKVVKPLGVKKIRIDADKMLVRKKINIEPGDRAWDALQNAAEANGLFPWFAPDGTLIVGGPDYSTPPVANLTMRFDGKGNNCESIRLEQSCINQFSEVTVLGQAYGDEKETGKHNINASYQDKSVGFYRPQIVTDHESDSQAVAQARARKLVADGRLSAFSLVIKVKGHRTSSGVLWSPGQRVSVFSEPHGIDGVYFLMGRTFSGGRDVPTTTTLRLKEDGVWTLDAHPHNRTHRRGKNSLPAMEIVEVNS